MVLITVSMPVSEFTCFLTVPVAMMISCYLLLSDITAVFTGAVTKYIYIATFPRQMLPLPSSVKDGTVDIKKFFCLSLRSKRFVALVLHV